MSKQPVNPYILELIKIYSDAQRRLIDIILKSEAKGNSTVYYKSLLSQVNQELKELDKKAKKWSDRAILETYKTEVNKINRDLLKLGIQIPESHLNTFSKIHKDAVNLIAQNCTDDLFQASSFVGRKINDVFRQAALEASAQSLTAGLTTKQMKELIKEKLLNGGLTAFVDSRGRNISLDAYSSMIARTTVTEATNQATTNQLQDLGYDLVKMTEHSPTCKLCAPLQGRVYSISGKDKRFPALNVAFSGGYANIHPNCFVDRQIPVLTSKGWKSIGDIKINDLVLTHKGRFKRVTYIHNNRGKPNLVKIKIKNGTRNAKRLHITAGHLILINGKWEKAENAKSGDNLRLLVKPCENCGKPSLLYMKSCSKKCSQELCYKRRDTPEYRKKLSNINSKRMNKLYSEGLIDGKERVKKAHEKIKKLIDTGEFVLQKPEVHIKAQKALGKKNYGKTWIEEKMGWFLTNVLKLDIESQFPIPQNKKDIWERERYYFADFLIKEHNIVIECDGSYWHVDKKKDLNRQKHIESLGYRVLRFSGDEIRNNLEKCGKEIKRVIANHKKQYIFKEVEITEVKITPLKRSSKLYNFSVDEDESYIAKGFVVHNCAHRVIPYIEKYNNVDEDIKKSNRPFDIDPRTKKEIDKYNEQQKKNREKWRDRKQWEKWKIVLGDDAPKTFASFRSLKKQYPEKFESYKKFYSAKTRGKEYLAVGIDYKTWYNNVKDIKWQAVNFAPGQLSYKVNTKHKNEYPGFTEEKYLNRAKELLNREPDNKNIFGFTDNDGWRYRYDKNNNEITFAKPDGTIDTLYKPTKKEIYWNKQVQRYGGSENAKIKDSE